MSVRLTDKVLPLNDAFVGMVDANQVLGGGASGVLPDATMPDLTGDVTTIAGAVATTIANGAVDIAHLSATGTPNATTYLRGDNSWNTPAGGSGISEELAIAYSIAL